MSYSNLFKKERRVLTVNYISISKRALIGNSVANDLVNRSKFSKTTIRRGNLRAT